MALDLTSFAAALKSHYTKDRVQNMVYKNNPLLGMLPKMEDMGGDYFVQPVVYGNPQSRSATFTTAQTNAASMSSSQIRFLVTRVKDYGVVTIDGETIEASKGNAHAFFEAKTHEIDGIMNQTSRSLATALYRDGWGWVGRISDTIGAATTITLGTSTGGLTPDAVANFEKGMKVVFSASAAGDTLRDSGATLTVSAVNRSAGTLTMSANLNTISGLAQNDYIFLEGDRQNSATPTRLKVAGLEAWCPESAPTSTAFFGVDRSVDSRLGGTRFDGSAMPIEEALIEGAILLGREGGTPDCCMMNHKNFGNLLKSLGTKVQYTEVGSKAGISWKAIELHTPAGTVKVVPDQNCPNDVAWMLQLNTWKLGSLGGVPRILNYDGLEALRQSTADGVEVRVGYYANLICNAPGWNGRIKLAI
jgi:hypothetical protein